jgi:quercetin dioxygenase-like cupin family protein
MNLKEKIVEKLKKEGYENFYVWKDEKGAHYDWHSHEYHEARGMLKGEMIINTKNSTHRLKPGDVLYVKPGELHEAYVLEECEYVCAMKKE